MANSLSDDWREIPGYPGYSANAAGQIRGISGRVLVQSMGDVGYLCVTPIVGGRKKPSRVHVLVCPAFRGPKPSPQHEAAHGDGNKTNNTEANLRWATRVENQADKLAHGTSNRGEKHGMAKLKRSVVDAIRKDHSDRLIGGRAPNGTYAALVSKYSVTRGNLVSILGRKSWNH